MYDGLASQTDIRTIGSIQAALISGNVAALGAGEIGAGEIASGAVTFSHLATNRIMTGSPSAGGLSVQAGTATLSAGSSVTVTFGTPFKATPYVVCTVADIQAGTATASGISTTGFTAYGTTAGKEINWIAIGSL